MAQRALGFRRVGLTYFLFAFLRSWIRGHISLAALLSIFLSCLLHFHVLVTGCLGYKEFKGSSSTWSGMFG